MKDGYMVTKETTGKQEINSQITVFHMLFQNVLIIAAIIKV